MKLSTLLEEYIKRAESPMFGDHRVPIIPKKSENVIIPTPKWVINDGKLEKKFHFISNCVRNKFLSAIFEYEENVGHNATIVIDHERVFIRLVTRDSNKISELDKEYARFADLVFRDLLYNNM